MKMSTNLPTNPQEGQRITVSQIPLIYLEGHWVLDKEALEPPPIRHRDIIERDLGIAHPAKVIAVEATGDSLEIDLKNIRQLITDLRKALTDSDDKDSQSFAKVWEALDEAVKNHEDLVGVVDNLKQTHQADAAVLKNDIKLSFATLVDNFTPILFDFDARLKQHKSDIANNKSNIDENYESLMQRLRDFRESLTEDIDAVNDLAKKANSQASTNKDRLDDHNTRLLALSQEDSEINNAISAINQTLESLGVMDDELDRRIKELDARLLFLYPLPGEGRPLLDSLPIFFPVIPKTFQVGLIQ
jgi:chromosome segregation ATPase